MNESYTFRKSLRLLTTHDFKSGFDKASIKHSTQHLLMLAHTTPLPQPRLGLVIPKKNIRLAVDRNRIKRLLRETFRLQQHQLQTLDVVVLARKSLSNVSDDQLFSLLTKHWRQLQKKASKQ